MPNAENHLRQLKAFCRQVEKKIDTQTTMASPCPRKTAQRQKEWQIGRDHVPARSNGRRLQPPPEGTLGYVTCALAATAQSAERKWARQWPIRP